MRRVIIDDKASYGRRRRRAKNFREFLKGAITVVCLSLAFYLVTSWFLGVE